MKDQILTLYEINALSIDDIAETMDLETAIVIAVLQQHSMLYRSRVNRGAEAMIDDIEQKEMVEIAKEVARDSRVNAATRAKTAIWVFEEGIGRNAERVNIGKIKLAGAAGAAQSLNNHLRAMRAMKQLPQRTAIEAEIVK
jgi:hypothetical protein